MWYTKNMENELEGYYLKRKVDFNGDKKAVTLVNLLCMFLMLTLAFVVYICFLHGLDKHQLAQLIYYPNFIIIVLGLIWLPVVHELIHSLAFRCFGVKTKRVDKFSGLFAYSGALSALYKNRYILVALAPTVILSLIFGVLLAFLPLKWIFGVAILECTVIGQSAGDFYIIKEIITEPKTSKILDEGLNIAIYRKKESTK